MTVETDVEVLKAQVKTLQDTSDAHEKQNREDFKEVHSRMTTMQRELNQEINLTFEKLYSKLEENNQEIRRICEEGFFDPYICKTFSLSEAKDSILYLSERKLIGKIVVKID